MTTADPLAHASWHRHDGDLLAVFEAPDHSSSARLGRALARAAPHAEIDVRGAAARVRLPGADAADADAASALRTALAQVDALALDAGLRPAPQALRELSVVAASAQPEAVAAYWGAVLGYRREGETLHDALRRRPPILVRRSSAPADGHAARSALHLDLARPGGPAAEDAPTWGGTLVGGPYGVCAADPDGNLADLLPAGPCWEDPAVSAWRGGFAAQSAWRTESAERAADFVEEAAAAADASGLDLAIDRRGTLVVLDSGKDDWETRPGFVDLAAEVQDRAARAGLVEETDGLGFVQAFLTVRDVPRSRAFWARTLGYREDPREGVLDLLDPRRLGPVLAFQEDEAPAVPSAEDSPSPFHLRLALPESSLPEVVEAVRTEHGTACRTGPDTWELRAPGGEVLELLALRAVAQP